MRDVGMNAGAKMREAGAGSVPRAAMRTRPALREISRWTALTGTPAAMTVLLSAEMAARSTLAPVFMLAPALTIGAVAFAWTRRAHVASRAISGLVPVALTGTIAAMMFAPGFALALASLTLVLFALVCGARVYDLSPRATYRVRFAASLLGGAAIGGGLAAMVARSHDAHLIAYASVAIVGLLLLPASERVRASLLRAPAWALGIVLIMACAVTANLLQIATPLVAAQIAAMALSVIACIKSGVRGVPALALTGALALMVWSA